MALHAWLIALSMWLGSNAQPAMSNVAQLPSTSRAQTKTSVAINNSDKDAPHPLQVGDEAPALSVDTWIKGGPIVRFEKGTVYIVEFWATWCKPCIEGIPHLSELQRQYRSRGLVAIGVASHEFADSQSLARFVEKRGEEIAYAIAYDGDKSMEFQWQTRGIPRRGFTMPEVFVIDAEGKIAWSGNPNSQKGEKLAKVIADLLVPLDQEEPIDTPKKDKP